MFNVFIHLKLSFSVTKPLVPIPVMNVFMQKNKLETWANAQRDGRPA